MNVTLRSLAVFVALALGAFALASMTRQSASHALLNSYGNVGVDSKGRLRHWRVTEDGGVVLLSAESVEVPGTRHQRGGDWLNSVGSLATIHTRETGRVHPRRGMATHVRNEPTLSEFVLLEEAGRKLVLQHQAGVSWLAHRDEGEYGYNLANISRIGDGSFKGEVLYTAATHYVNGTRHERRFIGIVGDEFWVLDMDGKFHRREKLGHNGGHAVAAQSWLGTIVLRFRGDQNDPAHTEFELVVCQPKGPILHRNVVLTPVTWDQHAWYATLFAVAAAGPVWLAEDSARVVAFVLALLCAFVAYRSVRLRELSKFWVAAALVLGPFGLLWMRLVAPWCALENGRPVNRGQWTAPAAEGTEVFA